jgi:hypothetical protein
VLRSAAVPVPPFIPRLGRRLVAPLRENIALSIAIAFMWAVTLAPIWEPRFLPLLDLPNHLDAIAIWHRFHDPSWGYQRFYRLNLLPLPYWGYFFPVHLLSYLMPIEVANKVYLSAYALALPLGAMWLARRTGRSLWLALLVFPLVFNFNFSLGFITFCGGMTLMIYAFVALDRFLDVPSRGRAVALFVLTTLLYTTHVLPWLFFGVGALPWLFFYGLRPRRMLAAAALMLPSVALGVFAFQASRDGSTHVQAGPLAFHAKWEQPMAGIEQAIHRVLATWPGTKPLYLMLGFAFVWLLLMATARPDRPSEPARGFPYRIEFLVALAALATLGLPAHLLKPVDLWMIGGRFVSVTALFLVLLPRGPIAGRGSGGRILLVFVAITLNLVYVNDLARQWRKFDHRVAAVRRLMELVPRGSSTLTLTLNELSDPAVDPQAVPYVQFHAYPQFFSGGFDPWALNTGFPMVALPDAKLPSPRWKQPRQFRFDQHGIYYDYILTHNESYDHQLFGPDDAGRAPLLKQDGEWRLYQVRDPVQPPKPDTNEPPEVLSPNADPQPDPGVGPPAPSP